MTLPRCLCQLTSVWPSLPLCLLIATSYNVMPDTVLNALQNSIHLTWGTQIRYKVYKWLVSRINKQDCREGKMIIH